MAGFTAEPMALQVYPELYRDLAEAPERVAAFYPSAPDDRMAWARRAETVRALWAAPGAEARRSALVAALRAYHDRMGLTSAQETNLQALTRGDALVVVAGQQAGLLGGPLFCAYKALGAVRRAAAAAAALGCPVVPVFWVASEDHDWSEVSRAQLAGPDGRLQHFALPGAGDFRSAGHVPLPAEARHLVGALTSLFPPTPVGAPCAEALWSTLRRPGRQTLADWFAAQLQALFGGTGLLLYDPMWPALRALAAPVFSGAAQRAAAANAVIVAAGERLAQSGYRPGLDIEPDHAHLFVYHQGRRVALHLAGDRLRTRDGAVDFPAGELPARALQEPTAFSPNVALRPVVQDFTLPVLCQLGGPGEVAYLAQLGAVFPLWDREAPPVAPRPGGTLLLPADMEALRACGATVEEVRQDVGAAVDRAAARACPLDLDALFAAERAELTERQARLRTALGAVAPTLPAIVDGNGERVLYQLAYLERKARQHRRRAQGGLSQGLRAAAGRLFPGGSLQERNSLLWPYLFTAGWGFLHDLAAALEVSQPDGRHWLWRWTTGGAERS